MWCGHPDLHMNKLEEILSTPDGSDIGYFFEVDLIDSNIIEEKTKTFPFCPENKTLSKNDFNEHMNEINPKNDKSHKKIICDHTDKKNNLIQYRMLRFYVRHGMIVDKILEIISFRQSMCLEKYINFNSQKENKDRKEV